MRRGVGHPWRRPFRAGPGAKSIVFFVVLVAMFAFGLSFGRLFRFSW
jgi:hypothetical protein